MYAQEELKAGIMQSLSEATGLEMKEIERLLEKPPEGIKADLAFPCFILAKKEKKTPAEIAKEVASNIKPDSLVEKIDSNGPYVNFHFDWEKLGKLVLKESVKKTYGSGKRKKEKIMVEFGHPNTHKAYHIGHLRTLIIGESLSRILDFSGSDVVRVNYQGDIGPHVAKCLWGLLNFNSKEPEKDKGRWLGVIYSKASQKIMDSEELEKQSYEINKKLYAGDKDIVKLWKKTRQWSLDYFETVYRDFGVKFDRYYFESEVEGSGIKLAQELLKNGTAKMSDGAIVMDLKSHGLGVYVLLTKDKTPLYSIKDFILAGLQDREYKPDKIIHVVGEEQKLHFQQLFKSLEYVSPDIAKKECHLWYGFVSLKSGKMSSRLGNVITYEELKERVLEKAVEITKEKGNGSKETADIVGLGSIVYDIIKFSLEKSILFDWDKALSFDGNTAPYIQYTHARASSILKKAKAAGHFDAKFLKNEKEKALVKKISEFPGAVQNSARDYRPHYIANYVFELATMFNEFYQAVPVLKAGKGEKEARLALVCSVKSVLKTGLGLLGIEAPDEM